MDTKGGSLVEYIYIDHAATTPIDPTVNETMYEHAKTIYGNPSSVHTFGRESRKYIDQARETIARSIHARDTEITFTSSGTEAINSALIGIALANKSKGNHLITSDQEHQATINTMRYLEGIGFEVTYVRTNETGQIEIEDIKKSIRDQTILVSIMMVNNETGVIQPIEEIGSICTDEAIYFHADAVQAFGPIELNVEDLSVDLLSISAHKINGPKGIGALYIRDGTNIQPIQFGGEQERKKRPGTENLHGIIGFKQAVVECNQSRKENQYMYKQCKEALLDALDANHVSYKLNGDQSACINGIVNISFPGTHVESMLMNLDIERIAASSGSACTAGTVEPSHVLQAMYGDDSERITNSIRFSFGKGNGPDQMKEAAKRIAAIIQRIKE